MYRPLDERLTIMNSKINGLGLFATEDIPAKTRLGITHFQIAPFGIIRTPLGGFINHSDDFNCIKIIESEGSNYLVYGLYTDKYIVSGEELTLYYTFYKVK